MAELGDGKKKLSGVQNRKRKLEKEEKVKKLTSPIASSFELEDNGEQNKPFILFNRSFHPNLHFSEVSEVGSSNPGGSLSSQPAPEYWCSVTYYELDKQVGETFKFPPSIPIITIDGSTGPSANNKICLGALSNAHRTEMSVKTMRKIGKGVQLELRGEGDLWLRYLLDYPVFLHSWQLDWKAGRQRGDVVHKIYPSAFLRVFHLGQYRTALRHVQAAVTATKGTKGVDAPSDSVHDFRRLCIVQLSFMKDWGSEAPSRSSIKHTPCRIEVQLHRALQLLDELKLTTPCQSTAAKHKSSKS